MADKRDVRSALRAYEQPSMLQGAWDEISGAFARYGRRSGAQRDASLAMLNQAVDPSTDPLTGAGMKALGLAGLVTHPLAFFPTGDEWRERTRSAGNTGRMGQAIGGMLGDLPSIVDPHLLAGGGALAAAPLIGKMAGKVEDVAQAADKMSTAGRAAVGGEKGVNGYLYKGGQFLPSTDAPPGTFRIKTKGKSTTIPNGQELIAPGQVVARPTPFSKSIFQSMGGGTYVDIGPDGLAKVNPRVNWDYLGTTPDEKTPVRFKNLAASKEPYSINDLIELYNNGARWIDLDPVDGVEIVAKGDK